MKQEQMTEIVVDSFIGILDTKLKFIQRQSYGQKEEICC